MLFPAEETARKTDQERREGDDGGSDNPGYNGSGRRIAPPERIIRQEGSGFLYLLRPLRSLARHTEVLFIETHIFAVAFLRIAEEGPFQTVRIGAGQQTYPAADDEPEGVQAVRCKRKAEQRS